MSKAQKIALAIGGVLLLALLVYIFWRRRWRDFTNIGDSRWLPTQHSDMRLAFRMPSKDHGIKVGDRIEVRHGSPRVPDGQMDVIDVVVKNENPYIVTNEKAPADNPDIVGELRVIS